MKAGVTVTMKMKLAGLLLLAVLLVTGNNLTGNPPKSPKQDENPPSRIARADLNYEKPAGQLSGNMLKFKTKKEDIVKIMPVIQ